MPGVFVCTGCGRGGGARRECGRISEHRPQIGGGHTEGDRGAAEQLQKPALATALPAQHRTRAARARTHVRAACCLKILQKAHVMAICIAA
jgi:hypothetical protein